MWIKGPLNAETKFYIYITWLKRDRLNCTLANMIDITWKSAKIKYRQVYDKRRTLAGN